MFYELKLFESFYFLFESAFFLFLCDGFLPSRIQGKSPRPRGSKLRVNRIVEQVNLSVTTVSLEVSLFLWPLFFVVRNSSFTLTPCGNSQIERVKTPDSRGS